MTVYGATRSFSLPFIPVGVERYELVTTRQMFDEDVHIRAIAEMIASQKFKEILIHLGGYEMENTGKFARAIRNTESETENSKEYARSEISVRSGGYPMIPYSVLLQGRTSGKKEY